MSLQPKKIKSFTDLQAWQKGHKLVIEIYKNTRSFPIGERFGLTAQLRRAGISYTSNIAEGFSRYSYKEKIRFYTTALGSLTEIQNQLLIAKDIGYIKNKLFNKLARDTIEISKITNGLIKTSREILKTRNLNSTP